MKLISVIGTRPQLIKASILSKQLKKDNFLHKIINSGQHYDSNLSSVFLRELFDKSSKIKNLKINSSSEVNFYSKLFDLLEKIFLEEKPDLVICYGDTNTTVCAALVASKMKIKLAHIEAGIRTYSRKSPEETNRILVDRLSDYLFCPTPQSRKNLKKEANFFPNSNIFYSGDVMRDLYEDMKNGFKKPSFKIPKNFILLTLHRQENVDDKEKLTNICDSLNSISEEYEIIFPIHPRTKKMLKKFKIKLNCTSISPQGYLEFQWLLKNSKFTITDSGGVQKEAFFHGKKCLLIYDGNSGWTELEKKGFFLKSKPNKNEILKNFNLLKSKKKIDNKDINKIFGSGKACKEVSKILQKI